MAWAVGYDEDQKRDIGYGVPSICDHPDCNEEIDRGLSFVCGGEPYGGEHGCGLFFCSEHLCVAIEKPQKCECCKDSKEPFKPKPDTQEWIKHKLTDPSWKRWRDENSEEVKNLSKEPYISSFEIEA